MCLKIGAIFYYGFTTNVLLDIRWKNFEIGEYLVNLKPKI